MSAPSKHDRATAEALVEGGSRYGDSKGYVVLIMGQTLHALGEPA